MLTWLLWDGPLRWAIRLTLQWLLSYPLTTMLPVHHCAVWGANWGVGYWQGRDMQRGLKLCTADFVRSVSTRTPRGVPRLKEKWSRTARPGKKLSTRRPPAVSSLVLCGSAHAQFKEARSQPKSLLLFPPPLCRTLLLDMPQPPALSSTASCLLENDWPPAAKPDISLIGTNFLLSACLDDPYMVYSL